jgi:uncharacterized membrane protein
MKDRKYWLYVFIFSVAIAYFSFIVTDVSNLQPRWNLFSDVGDYKRQSEASLASLDFYAPKPNIGKWFFPRPFMVPLFFKIAGTDPRSVVILQKVVYCICVLSLLLSILQYIKNYYLKILSLLGFLFFFTWWNIVGWSTLPLSESLSISFMFLWFSSILWYFHKPGKIQTAFLVLAAFLLSFTRDTWPYVLLLFFSLNILLAKWLMPQKFKTSITLFGFALCLYFVQGYTAERGERFRMPVFNTFAARIAQNDDYLSWFKKEGMPLGDTLKKDFRGLYLDSDAGKRVIYFKYVDGTYEKLFDWIVKEGKGKYQKFLLTHPAYLFLDDVDRQHFQDNVFSYNLLEYYQPAEGFCINAEHIFPVFNSYWYLLIICLSLYPFLKTKKIIYAFPSILFLLFFANAMLSYNADGLEINRHLYITRIVLEFCCLLTITLLVNYYLSLRNIKTQNMKEYMLYIRNAGDAKAALTPEEHLAFVKKCEVYIGKLKAACKLIAAQPIVREGYVIKKNGSDWSKTTVDANTEVQVGYYHIFANNIEEAVEMAKENPEFEFVPSASIEVRPIKMKEEQTNFVYPKG